MTGSITPSGDIDFYDLGIAGSGYRLFAVQDSAAGSTTDLDLRVTNATAVLEYDTGDNDVYFGGSAGNVAGTPMTGVQTYLRVGGSASEPYRLYSVVQPPIEQAKPKTKPKPKPKPVTTRVTPRPPSNKDSADDEIGELPEADEGDDDVHTPAEDDGAEGDDDGDDDAA